MSKVSFVSGIGMMIAAQERRIMDLDGWNMDKKGIIVHNIQVSTFIRKTGVKLDVRMYA